MEEAVFHTEPGAVQGMEAYARAHAWALQRARVAAWLRLPTPRTLFGLAMRHDGIDALITLSVAAGLGAVERSRLEAAVLALDGIDLIALVEPVTGSGRPATPVAITVRDGDYELRVLSRTEPARANVVPGMQLMARARLLQ